MVTIGRSRKSRRVGDDFRIEKGYLSRFLEHIIRKDVRQMVLANDNFNIDSKGVFVAQHLNDPAARGSRWRRPFGDLDIDDETFQIVEALPFCLFS